MQFRKYSANLLPIEKKSSRLLTKAYRLYFVFLPNNCLYTNIYVRQTLFNT